MLVTRRVLTAWAVCAVLLAALMTPSAGAAPPPKNWVQRTIDGMTLREKVGQMFMTFGYGQRVDDPDPAMVAANRTEYGVDNTQQLIEKYHLGGVIYFAWSNNVNNPQQIAGLSNGVQRVATSTGSEVPALVSTDQEGGIVARVLEPATQFPGNMALGAARDPQLARSAAEITGRELAAIGINQDLAPVADVNVNAQNPVIGVRSFSSNPSLVSDLTVAQVQGYEQNVAATAKHFPGHGDTNTDSHTGLPVISHSRSELDQIDLPPFRAAIAQGIDAIMTAHIVVPALDASGRPATLSKPILTGLLRKEMGYNGVVITDALDMQGVREMFGDDRVPVEAIKAGADILLMPPEFDLAYNSVLDAVRSGEIGEGRINHSVRRILTLKQRLGLIEDPYVDESQVSAVVGTPANYHAADAITDRTVTVVKNDEDRLPLEPDAYDDVFVTGWGVTTTSSLASHISERGPTTSVYETGADPSAAQRQAAVTQAEGSDLIVVTTQRAWAASGQQQLVKDLLATGTPVVVVAVRDPYDIAYFDSAPTYVATYGWKDVSLGSVTEVMFGEVSPTGLLPVDIPRADDPAQTLYPYGFGFTY